MTITKVKSGKVNLDFIKQEREKNNLTLSDMSKMMGFTSVDKYYRRETGEYNFKASEIPMLSKILKQPIKNFFAN